MKKRTTATFVKFYVIGHNIGSFIAAGPFSSLESAQEWIDKHQDDKNVIYTISN
jgi:hypothetical protein